MVKEVRELNKEEAVEVILERFASKHRIENIEEDTYIVQLSSDAFDEFGVITGSETIREDYVRYLSGVVDKWYMLTDSDVYESESRDGYSATYKDEDAFAEYIPRLALHYPIKIDIKGAKRPASVRFF